MNITISKSLSLIILISILFLGGAIRLYKISFIPPSISWDEAAVGYNAWTIVNYGKDEWGKKLPPYFTSFRDDKHPIHIYLTAFSVAIFGLSEFSVRLPSAFFGLVNIVLIFLLANNFFKSKLVGLFSSFMLAFSPYNIHFSRYNHELNFVLFFFLLAMWCFFVGIKKMHLLLVVSFLSFGICLIAYHSAKIVVPCMIGLLLILYIKKLMNIKKYFFASLVVLSLFIILVISNPALLGTARVKQTSFSNDEIKQTYLYQKTSNLFLGRINITFNQYLSHFGPQYLFFSGDKNPRLSSQGIGEFYKLEAIFLIIGFISLVLNVSRISIILLVWALIAPLPSSLVNESPHAARAMFMTGSWHLIAAFGFYKLIGILSSRYFKIGLISFILLIYLIQIREYLIYYFNDYGKKYAIEWQYGMSDVVNYTKKHPEYSQVYVTDERHEPYIFFLFYLKNPLPDYLSTVEYTTNESKTYNLVQFYDKYFFGDWGVVDSIPGDGVLYVLTPSQYDGLKYKSKFKIKQEIKYPNQTTAFYLVSVN